METNSNNNNNITCTNCYSTENLTNSNKIYIDGAELSNQSLNQNLLNDNETSNSKKFKLDLPININKTVKKEWIQDKSKRSHYRQINDIVHESIQIFHPLQKIIDTPEFQRLRYVRQLGFCYLVYPAADHCRFTHSLGVYSLAYSFVKELAESQPQLKISSQDQLCVCIAALIHDIGHGPFSHFYDVFLNAVNPNHNFKHESYSKQIFRRMIVIYDELRLALEEYLSEDDFVFIEELIDPPLPFISDSKWQLKGRSIEKSFLYDIVNNKHNGFDVVLDKFDYFLRDSLLGNVPIPFSKTTIGRIRDNARVFMDKNLGFKSIIFSEKNMDEIRDAFEARVMLYDRIYKHKTCIAVEIL